MNKVIKNEIEQEILMLSAVVDMLHDMHNYQIIEPLSDAEEKTIIFKTSVSYKLYFILLSDFLGKFSRQYRLDSKEITILEGLNEVVNDPQLGDISAVSRLKDSLNELVGWLEFKPSFKQLWFPDLDREVDLTISRRDMIFICANMNKHSVLNLTGVRARIKDVFQESGIDITEEQAILCMENFHGWFYDDILHYHSSVIFEMLVRIQWSIVEYLEALYNESYKPNYGEDLLNRYSFEPPAQYNLKSNEFIFRLYWNLMNYMLGKPIIPEFTTSRYLKGRY